MNPAPFAPPASLALAVCRDAAGPDELLAHLRACDASFVPALSARVDLADYARKLHEHAVRFEAWEGGDLAGLVAAYLDPARACGFVTSVSVLPTHLRRGLARRLMGECLARARDLGVHCLELEVSRQAVPAIGLYERLGFRVEGAAGEMVRMRRAEGGQGCGATEGRQADA
jgi:ribosomal protein S18 acetylase RimI-like enzyme